MPSVDRRNGTFEALKVRDFALLWSGQTISSLGDGVFTIALALTALEIGHGAIDLAYVLAARAVPSVCFALLGGVVVDRVPKRLAMLTSDVVRGLAVGVVALLIANHDLRMWQLIAMSAVFGTADAFFGPASLSILPELLDENLLAQGNALNTMSGSLTQGLIGPAVGGLVVGSIGFAWSFGIDAISFAGSAICLLAMRIRTMRSKARGSALAEALEGISYVRKTRWLIASLAAAALANFVGMMPLTVLLPVLVRNVLHASALSLGLVFAAGGAAGVVASLVVARMGSPRLRVTVLWIAYAGGGLAILLMAFAVNVWVVGLVSAIEIGLYIYGDVLWVTMMQELVPRDVLGRVSSLVYLLAFALGPLGILLGGVLAAAIGIRETLFVSGLVSTLICMGVIVIPGVRDPERPVGVNPQSGLPA
jgi:DHA3 family tetracycline resistance protein-like MFS transporter